MLYFGLWTSDFELFKISAGFVSISPEVTRIIEMYRATDKNLDGFRILDKPRLETDELIVR